MAESWDIEAVTAKRRAMAAAKFPDATEAVLDHIAATEAALYCLAYPLSELDIEPGPRRAAYATSKLFPTEVLEIPEGTYGVFDPKKKEFVGLQIPLQHLHEHDYEMAESIMIDDGSKLSDDFEVLRVHQTAIAAYIGCGAIWMRDIRRAAQLLWPRVSAKAA